MDTCQHWAFTVMAGAALVVSVLTAEAVDETKKVVFVAGKPSHGYGAHEHNAGCLLLSELLNEHHSGVDSVVYQNGWPDDPDAFDDADSIVIYSDGGGGHPAAPHRDQLGELLDEGVGFVIIHWAFPGKKDDQWVEWLGGNKEPHWSVNPHWVLKNPELGDHPINRGVEPYSIDDEWYYHMRFRENMEGVTPILSAHPPSETVKRDDGPYSSNPHVREAVLERGEIQHVAWAAERENGGRSFGFTGGHWHWNWAHPMFRRQVLNAIVWTAGAEVPEGGVPAPVLTLEDLEANQDEDQGRCHWGRRPGNWRHEEHSRGGKACGCGTGVCGRGRRV